MPDPVSAVSSVERRPQALTILYQHLSEPDRQRQIARLLQTQENDKPISLDGLLLCTIGDRPAGAMMSLAGSGRVVMAWPPVAAESVAEEDRPPVWKSLLSAADEFGRQRGARFIQLLESDADDARSDVLAESEYGKLTELVYARRKIDPGESFGPLPAELACEPFRDEWVDDLSAILESTYTGSLDCPELTGLRAMEDILASHRSQGEHGTDHWLMVRWQDRWAGCLLLSSLRAGSSLEISYLGVVPEARGLGIGRALAEESARRAAAEGCSEVVLAVDARNAPALAMYEDAGFEPWDVRTVYLRVLDPADGRFDRRD